MKNKFKCLIIIMLAVFAGVRCSGGGDIILQDFESGSFGEWTAEGDAFGAGPSSGPVDGQQTVKGYRGKYFANSYHAGDDSRGTLTSPEFRIERDYINFLIGGGMSRGTYAELLVDGNSVYRTSAPNEGEELDWMSWDVKQHKGNLATIKVVDNRGGGWGHIIADQFEMGNKEKSSFMSKHQIIIKIDKKYILIPVQDTAPESPVVVAPEGGPEMRMNIRLAKTAVDYFVPIDVERLQGSKTVVTLSRVKKEDKAISGLRQSDTFDFDYNEKYRLTYHFTPRYGWTNDPNGMVYYDGEYHLYYQHNPYGSKWGNMHWGHAVTRDFTKWTHKPVAIAPDSLGTIFSGSAVIDKENTSGFGKDAMVAIYTSAGRGQVQSIAYSNDGGTTYKKYDHNPVLADPSIRDFRDPKVLWHPSTGQWVMALATSQTITFYGSEDLKQWERLSEFGDGVGAHGGVWECPDLFPLKTPDGKEKWVLFVSINPGGPNGGSATQYFLGDFDGKTFIADPLPYPLWLDYGRDNYAGVTWSNAPDSRRIFIGWMSNWAYTNDVPTINFRNGMTLPRELRLASNGKHLVVANPPVKEIESLRRDERALGNITVSGKHTIQKMLPSNEGAFEIEMTLNAGEASTFAFSLKNQQDESLDFTFDLNNSTLVVDRSQSGSVDFNPDFAMRKITSPIALKKQHKVRLLMDKASSELFLDDGITVQTNIIFSTEPYNTLVFDAGESRFEVKELKIYSIK